MPENIELVDNMSVKSFLQNFIRFITSVFKPGGYTPTPTTDRGNYAYTPAGYPLVSLKDHIFSRQ